jgi:hypothetical protein
VVAIIVISRREPTFNSNMSKSELLNLHSLSFCAQCLVYRKNLAEYLPPSEMKQIRKKRSSVRAESSSPDGVTAAGDRKREGGDRKPEGEESNPAKKRRLTSDSSMVGGRNYNTQ